MLTNGESHKKFVPVPAALNFFEGRRMSKSVLIISSPASQYIADEVYNDLLDAGVKVRPLNIDRKVFPNGEKYYRMDVNSSFEVLGDTAVYIASLVDDNDFLELYRLGATLAQAGLRRRIFVIPYAAYSYMFQSSSKAGEVSVSKYNAQMLGVLGHSDEGNMFIFIDLRYPTLLHHFEGRSLRTDLHSDSALLSEIRRMRYDTSKLVMGATNLERAEWVNRYASQLDIPVAFLRERDRECENPEGVMGLEDAVVGDVRGFHVLIFDDLVLSGRTIIAAAKKYLAEGATGVDACCSHLACDDEEAIHALIDSPIGTIITTDSHPVTQHPLIKGNKKFRLLKVAQICRNDLLGILSDRTGLLRNVSI
jgi:ribose-phosphate pyrophosphokinase